MAALCSKLIRRGSSTGSSISRAFHLFVVHAMKHFVFPSIQQRLGSKSGGTAAPDVLANLVPSVMLGSGLGADSGEVFGLLLWALKLADEGTPSIREADVLGDAVTMRPVGRSLVLHLIEECLEVRHLGLDLRATLGFEELDVVSSSVGAHTRTHCGVLCTGVGRERSGPAERHQSRPRTGLCPASSPSPRAAS